MDSVAGRLGLRFIAERNEALYKPAENLHFVAGVRTHCIKFTFCFVSLKFRILLQVRERFNRQAEQCVDNRPRQRAGGGRAKQAGSGVNRQTLCVWALTD